MRLFLSLLSFFFCFCISLLLLSFSRPIRPLALLALQLSPLFVSVPSIVKARWIAASSLAADPAFSSFFLFASIFSSRILFSFLFFSPYSLHGSILPRFSVSRLFFLLFSSLFRCLLLPVFFFLSLFSFLSSLSSSLRLRSSSFSRSVGKARRLRCASATSASSQPAVALPVRIASLPLPPLSPLSPTSRSL